jgi:circadian clock protein KaiC
MERERAGADEIRRLLNKLVARFKLLDVTSLLTAESRSLYFGDSITEGGFSPVADNLLMLRYVPVNDELFPAIKVVKTRGSAHDRGTHSFHLGKGGASIMRISLKSGTHRAPNAKSSSARPPPRKKRRPQ